MSLSAFRPLFQPIFLKALTEKTQACAALVPDAFVADLVRYPQAVAGGDGKRVRPYLMWLLAQAGDGDAFIRFTSALEFFHAFALVHDDIIDRGALRRGVPTTHTYAVAQMTQAGRVGDLVHVGDAQALLVGDLLFQWARELFQEGAALFSEERFRIARTAFDRMVNEVIVGQMVDVDITTRRNVSMALIQTKMRLKTAGYTFVRPMQIGTALAGSDVDAPWLASFGESLGIAFQIQDDAIDLMVMNGEARKTVFSDLRANQPTMFTQHIVENGTPAERTELAALMGAELTDTHRERVTRLFTDSGAIAFGASEIARLLGDAEAALKQAPEQLHAPLQELIESVRHRKS